MMMTTNEIIVEDKTIGFYIERFLKARALNSINTSKNYESALQMISKEIFNKDLYDLTKGEIESLTFDKITDYMYHLLENRNTNNTVNSRLGAIRSFIRFLSAREVINYDVSKLDLIDNLKDDSEKTEMIPEETLMRYVDYFEQNERNGLEKKWASLLLLETGNRADEIVQINKNQFVKDGDTYILKSKGKNRGKGNKEYFERIGSEMYEELMKLNPELDRVFSISYRSLYDAFQRANDHFENKLIRYTPHSIKHLTLLLEWRYTGDILAVQRKGKHSSLETTRRYLKIEDHLIVGAYTRGISTNLDKYKEVELSTLISVIDTLPLEFRVILNQKLENTLK